MFIIEQDCTLFTEVDDYEEGCQPETARTGFIKPQDMGLSVYYATPTGCLKDVMSTLNAAADTLSLNSCGEIGRLDIQKLSTRRGSFHNPSTDTMDKWKRGEKTLYFQNITLYITEVGEGEVRKPCDLSQWLAIVPTAYCEA